MPQQLGSATKKHWNAEYKEYCSWSEKRKAWFTDSGRTVFDPPTAPAATKSARVESEKYGVARKASAHVDGTSPTVDGGRSTVAPHESLPRNVSVSEVRLPNDNKIVTATDKATGFGTRIEVTRSSATLTDPILSSQGIASFRTIREPTGNHPGAYAIYDTLTDAQNEIRHLTVIEIPLVSAVPRHDGDSTTITAPASAIASEAIRPRRYVVIQGASSADTFTALPILTYGSNGTAISGVVSKHHCIIFTPPPDEPEPTSAERVRRQEDRSLDILSPTPIRVVPVNRDERLDPLSRLYLRGLENITYRHPMRVFGRVHSESRAALWRQFANVWNAPQLANGLVGGARPGDGRLESTQPIQLPLRSGPSQNAREPTNQGHSRIDSGYAGPSPSERSAQDISRAMVIILCQFRYSQEQAFNIVRHEIATVVTRVRASGQSPPENIAYLAAHSILRARSHGTAEAESMLRTALASPAPAGATHARAGSNVEEDDEENESEEE